MGATFWHNAVQMGKPNGKHLLSSVNCIFNSAYNFNMLGIIGWKTCSCDQHSAPKESKQFVSFGVLNNGTNQILHIMPKVLFTRKQSVHFLLELSVERGDHGDVSNTIFNTSDNSYVKVESIENTS